MSRARTGRIVPAALGAWALVAACVAAIAVPDRPAPAREALPGLAAELATRLAGRTVGLPGGGDLLLVDSAGSSGEGQALLDPGRILTCLDTISEAGAWPSAWLIVQDLERPQDVIVHVRLEEEGRLADPDVLVAMERRQWNPDVLEDAVREATGRRLPRERSRNVVVQSFSKRVVTTYVYEAPRPDGKKEGLAALLPEGAVLREARSVDLGDGRRRTLALALVGGRFLSSACSSCADRFFGHADSGQVLLLLAGEKAVEDSLDLTPHLRGVSGQPILPRFACTEADAVPSAASLSYEERFAGREPVRLLELQDLGDDGRRLEVALPGEFLDCGRRTWLVLGVDPKTGKLRIVSERLERPQGLDAARP